jgi:hypothetical protein
MSRIRGIATSYDPLQRASSRKHLPKSKVSLVHYESLVDDELRGGLSTSDLTEEQRLLMLEGWRAGKRPGVVAVEIERRKQDQESRKREYREADLSEMRRILERRGLCPVARGASPRRGHGHRGAPRSRRRDAL